MGLERLTAAGRELGRRLGSRAAISRTIGLGISVARTRGVLGLGRAVASTLFPSLRFSNYARWVKKHDTIDSEALDHIRSRAAAMAPRPMLSVILPVYNPPPEMLRAAIESIIGQAYDHWQLCIADDASSDPTIRKVLEEYRERDPRIEVVFRSVNGHISECSNSAIALARGAFLVLFDHDDLLPPHALYCVAKTILNNPGVKMIFSDEDKITASGERFDPYFKPDWNLGLMYGHNMFSHLGVFDADLVRAVDGFRKGYEGAQDYDLTLRCAERIAPEAILHIPRVLYHWRTLPSSTASRPEAKGYAIRAAERAINDHFERTATPATVAEIPGRGMTRLRGIAAREPSVAIIVPTKDNAGILKTCINSILEKTTYRNFEVIIVDNGSTAGEARQTISAFAARGVRVISDPSPFNYSAINNRAVATCNTEFVCLLNDDTEVIGENWLSEMVSCALLPRVAAVGAKLLFPDRTVQHDGVVLGLGGVAGHIYAGESESFPGMMWRASLAQEMTAVTAACMLVRRSAYLEVQGLDEVNLAVAYNDVDFCLRLRAAGYKIYWTPNALLYHHESRTRGSDVAIRNLRRFNRESDFMRSKWPHVIAADPAFNPNLSLEKNGTDYADPPRLPRIRDL